MLEAAGEAIDIERELPAARHRGHWSTPGCSAC